MGKMNELFRLLEKGDKEELELFFLDKGFSRYSAKKAITEFSKAFYEINNKGQDDEKNYTKTTNLK